MHATRLFLILPARARPRVRAALIIALALDAKLARADESVATDLSTMGHALFGLIVLSIVLAHLLTNTVVKRYARRMLELMSDSSVRAFGEPPQGVASQWPAERLLQALAERRRAIVRVLIGVVVLFALTATASALYVSGSQASLSARALYALTSFMTFAAFCAPVVLLGASAANFDRLYWTWFAPTTFAALSLQGVMVSSDELGADVGWALTGIIGILVILLLMPRQLLGVRQALRRWCAVSRWRLLAALLAGNAVSALAVLGMLQVPALYHLGIGCLFGGAAIVICYYTLVDRIRRIVAPMLGFGLFSTLLGGLAAWAVIQAIAPGLGSWLFGIPAGLLALALGMGLAQFVLSWVGLAYEQKIFSDAQFQVFCWMMGAWYIIVLFNTLAVEGSHLLDPFHLGLFACTSLALGVYWVAVRYGVRPLHTNKRLLVLRVFSREQRGEQLLAELEEHWRHLGPLMLIGGTDVAMRTIDPAKAANFLRGRLDDICVPNAFVLHKRVAAMDEWPDPDGRYRVNEFFCTDDLWKDAVSLLLASSDAVVVDLSEFTASRAGTAYELKLLKEQGALARTALIVSGQTDRDAVRLALDVPPGHALGAGALVEVDRRLEGKVLVEALVRLLQPQVRSAPSEAGIDAIITADLKAPETSGLRDAA
jgi:hypothetical protein